MDYYENVDISNLTCPNKLWMTMKPIFLSKIKSKNSITLAVGTKIIQKEGELAKTFNEFFISIVKSLEINENLLHTSSSEIRNVESIIAKFGNHPSIVTIRNRFNKNSVFSFKEIGKTEVIKEIKNLDVKKGSPSSDKSTEIRKEFSDSIVIFITENFNLYLNKREFREILKIAEVTPIIKKTNPFEKDNYKPISILSNISRIYERIMHNQINDFFINKLSKYQCDFRKGFATQHCLLVMIEKLRKIRDNKRVFAAVFTDLSKAFDCISHKLLFAK